MTRVLVLSDLWQPFPGGAERLAYNLARDLDSRGMEVGVLTGYEAARDLDGPRVAIAPIGIGDHHQEGWGYVEGFLWAFKPDVILTHHLYVREFHQELAACGIPVVQVVLNGGRIPEAALAVYISDWVRAQDPDARDTDLTVLPPAFPDVVAGTHGEHIGFIKPIPHKGVAMVYALAAAFPRRKFLILRGEWQTLEVVKHCHNVVFMDPVVDMREFYAQCRLLLVPSLSEDAGTVAQEATVNGLPCVSSWVGGLPETNRGGILLDPQDRKGWERAITMLDDPDYYAATVAQQQTALALADTPGQLAALAARIRSL